VIVFAIAVGLSLVVGAGTVSPATAAGSKLTGTASGPAGPLVGVGVYLYAASAQSLVASTTTDANGTLVFGSIASGTYRLLVWPADPTLPATWYPAAATWATASDITVSADATEPISIVLAPAARIVGHVHDGEIGLRGISVWITRHDGSLAAVKSTDANGEYVVPSLHAGTYKVAFVDPTEVYAAGAHWLDGADAGSATPLTVDAGATFRADQRLYLPADQPVPPYAGDVTEPRVAVIGDSITQMSTSAIQTALAPIATPAVRGINNQRIDQLQPVAERFAATDPDQVVIALGANDAMQGWPLVESEAALETMISSFPRADCIGVVTVDDHTANASANEHAAALNTYVRSLPDRYTNVETIDWEQIRGSYLAAGSPDGEWTTDTLHLNSIGQAAYASAMRSLVADCTPAAAEPTVVTRSYEAGAGPWHVQSLIVESTGGTYRLQYQGRTTAALDALAPACDADPQTETCAPTSVQGALAAVGAPAVVTDGPRDGVESASVRYTITFDDPNAPRLLPVDVQLTPADAIASVDCVFCVDTEVAPPVNANGAAVIYAHGGGFISGDRSADGWPDARARLAAAGYRTYSINYRLLNPAMFDVKPFGELCDWSMPTKTAGCQAWLDAADNASADLNRAVSWVRAIAATDGVDPNRVAVIGASAGAIAALHNHYAPADPNGQPNATISLSGIMDTARQTSAAGPVMLFSFAGSDPAYAGQFLDGIDAQQRNEEIIAAAGGTGNTAHLRSYPGQGHDINAGSPFFDDMMATALAFLDQSLRSPSPSTTLGGTWLGEPTGFALGQGQSAGHIAGSPPQPLGGDFNGDGNDDVIWHTRDGQADMLWYGSPDGVWHDPKEWDSDATTYAPAIAVGADRDGIVGDFDGDGSSDIIWYQPATGIDTELWNGQTTGGFAKSMLGDLPSGLTFTSADLDGDHRDDLVVHDAANGTASLWQSGTEEPFRVAHSNSTMGDDVRPVIGDFTGDGIPDVYWQNEMANPLWVPDASGNLTQASAPSIGVNHEATVGDIDGNGADDVIWYDPTTGADTQVWFGQHDASFLVANAGALPPGLHWYLADMDDEPADDLIAYAPAYRASAAFLNNGVGQFGVVFLNTDLPSSATEPFIADLNGDGRADLTWPF